MVLRNLFSSYERKHEESYYKSPDDVLNISHVVLRMCIGMVWVELFSPKIHIIYFQ